MPTTPRFQRHFIAGSVFYSGAMFMAYEAMAELSRKNNVNISPTVGFLQGCIAAGVAQTAAYPMDTIRKKMQV